MLSPNEISKIIDYNPLTGVMRWKERARNDFESDSIFKMWSARFAGKEVGTIHRQSGGKHYRIGNINRRLYRMHRVAWAIHYGAWPNGEIDHINGNGCDNRICNLRDVNSSENRANVRRQSNNTSGVTGVTWDKNRRKWKAQIKKNGKIINIGRFDDFDDAVSARTKMQIDLGFHDNHGKERPLY